MGGVGGYPSQAIKTIPKYTSTVARICAISVLESS
jgi:hypothetical protein